MTPKLARLLAVTAVVLPLDWLTKWWVAENVSALQPITLIPGFLRITHARNPGIAFGMLQDFPVYIFVGLTAVALILVLSFYRQLRADDRHQATALGLILAGALGNLYDRLVEGEVVDFIQFDLGLFVFPDFNVADSSIVIGVALMVLSTFVADGGESGRDPEDRHAEGDPAA